MSKDLQRSIYRPDEHAPVFWVVAVDLDDLSPIARDYELTKGRVTAFEDGCKSAGLPYEGWPVKVERVAGVCRTVDYQFENSRAFRDE